MEAVRHQLQDELAGQEVDAVFRKQHSISARHSEGPDQRRTGRQPSPRIWASPSTCCTSPLPRPRRRYLLKVRFADVDRRIHGQLWHQLLPQRQFGNRCRSDCHQPVQPFELSGRATASAAARDDSPAVSPLSNALNLFLYNKSIDLGALVNFLQAKNLLRDSGRAQSAGHRRQGREFPGRRRVSVSRRSSLRRRRQPVSISFRTFGISLQFVPTSPRAAPFAWKLLRKSAPGLRRRPRIEGFNVPGTGHAPRADRGGDGERAELRDRRIARQPGDRDAGQSPGLGSFRCSASCFSRARCRRTRPSCWCW